MKTSKARAQAKITRIIEILRKTDPDMANEFAEALAMYSVLNGVSINRSRMHVWIAGPDGADKLRDQLAALPD